MLQTKKGSIMEAVVNTFIGFLITCAVAPLIYWSLSIKMNAGQLGLANLLFTLVSVIRNYVIRRIFNRTQIFSIKTYE